MTDSEFKELVAQAGTAELTDEERKRLDGSFIRLPSGNTHYEMKGSVGAKTVVLVHGYATPYFIYDKIFDGLTAAGYRVLRYDLYGRGFSERVKTDYTPAFFARQLRELTSALLGESKFILVGTSMGGSITTAFCAAYPGYVEKLILLAPAGIDSFRPPFLMKVSAAPGIGRMLFGLIGNKTLLKNSAAELIYSKDEYDHYLRSFARSIRYKGFLECTHSSLVNTILRTDETVKGYFSVSEQAIPMLVIWGTEDKTMPIYQAQRLREICPSCELKVYEGSGHIFVYDEGERTLSDIVPFIEHA